MTRQNPEPATHPPDPTGPCHGCVSGPLADKVEEAVLAMLAEAGLESLAPLSAANLATVAYLRALQPDWGRLCAACEDEYRMEED